MYSIQCTICNRRCQKCFPKKYKTAVYHKYLPENEELSNKPLIVIQRGSKKIYPSNVNGKIYLADMNITVIFAKTLLYMNIRELDIHNNQITWLPEILSLEKLNCSNCKIKELSINLPKLKELNCSDNLITHMEFYPQLKKLNISDNIIYKLPNYNLLESLICNNNPITNIKIQTLTNLEAYGCPLAVIYKIPTLHKKSSISINGTIKYLLLKKERINNNKCLINWYDKTCSSKIYNRLISNRNNMIKKLTKFLFKSPI